MDLKHKPNLRKPSPKFGWTAEPVEEPEDIKTREFTPSEVNLLLQAVEDYMRAETEIELAQRSAGSSVATHISVPNHTHMVSGGNSLSAHSHSIGGYASNGYSNMYGYQVTASNEAHVQDILAGTHIPLGSAQ